MSYALPKIDLHTLHSSDGSATYTSPTSSHTLLCGVNYPLELPYRSKELPEDTYVEVNLRPHNGVGQVRERHIEQLVKSVLQSIIRGEETPRCYLQCTIQVTQVEEDESLPGGTKGEGQGGSYLEVLAGAVNAAVLGCLDGGVQMRGIAGACVVAVGRQGDFVVWPGLKLRKSARSLHVFAFGREGECLLCESEGDFAIEEWIEAERLAMEAVVGRKGCDDEDEDVQMEEETVSRSLFHEIRSAVEAKVSRDKRWEEQ